MSAPSRIDDSALTILLDLRHPHSYLALGPAMDFGRKMQIEINWLPLQVPTLNPPSEPSPRDDRGVLHRRSRARAIAREIEIYSEDQGLEMSGYYRDVDARAVHRGWLWMRQHAPVHLGSFLTEVFRRYWCHELDATRVEEVARIVAETGGDQGGFLEWSRGEGAAVVAALSAELGERGLTGVPGYLARGEFFLGRQHLPMIRWLLEGRPGSGPI